VTTFQTMGDASRDAITVRGHDLVSELIGGVGFTDMILLELTGRLPDPAARSVLDAVLVALTEHGLTPSAVAARLTDLGAPAAMQAAVAAGLLGAGDRFLGALDGCAQLLQEWPAEADPAAHAHQVVSRLRGAGQRVPGLGHPTHTTGDPRTPALYAVADAAGLSDISRRRLDALRAATGEAAGRDLPVNVDGACAAVLTELGLPWRACRGVALVARCAGLVGHLLDERNHPTATAIWRSAEQTARYQAPDVR